MSSLRWLNLFRRSAKTKTNRAARKARAKANISFEPLEPRVMLSNTTLLWTNGGLIPRTTIGATRATGRRLVALTRCPKAAMRWSSTKLTSSTAL